MYDNYRNIYQAARKTAGLTQERAAEALGICVESIRAYEQGQRVPSDEVVSRMVDLYDNRFLAVQHLRANAELARRIIPEMAEMPLSEAIMQLLSQIYAFADKHRDKDLLSTMRRGPYTIRFSPRWRDWGRPPWPCAMRRSTHRTNQLKHWKFGGRAHEHKKSGPTRRLASTHRPLVLL